MRYLLVVLLCGCTSAPDSLSGMKNDQRWEVYKACREQFREHRTSGIVYKGIDQFSFCIEHANRVVR